MATAISTITPEQLHAAQLRGDRPALLAAVTSLTRPCDQEQEQDSSRQLNQRSKVI